MHTLKGAALLWVACFVGVGAALQKDCLITTTRRKVGLDGVPYGNQTHLFWMCPPCAFLTTLRVFCDQCALRIIFDAKCSDGSSVSRTDSAPGAFVVGYLVFTSPPAPPGAVNATSASGFSKAVLTEEARTVFGRPSYEWLKRNLVLTGGAKRTRLGGFSECPHKQYVIARRKRTVQCSPSSRIVGILATAKTTSVTAIDFVCGTTRLGRAALGT